MGKNLAICDAIIHPGESANLALPLPEQFSCAPLFMPIKVVNGKHDGPVLLVFSTVSGIELNGIEIVNRLVESLDVNKLCGTVIAIPVINVYGLSRYPSVLPSGRSFEHCFPGKKTGTFGERFAYTFTHEILKKADYCIELQTGGIGHSILPQVYCNFEDSLAKKLAKSFQTPIITNVDLQKSNLRKTTEDLNIPLLVYQAGEALRFDENAISVGIRGLTNVMGELGLIKVNIDKTISPIPSKEAKWIVANKSGVLHTNVALGQTVAAKELLGTIKDPFGNEVLEPVFSRQEGIVVGINMAPLVHEGLSIFNIASFLDTEKAGQTIEKWDKSNQSDL